MHYIIPKTYKINYANIPKRFYEYLDIFLKNEIKNSSFHRAVIEHPKETFRSINYLFKGACEITGLECEELLKKLDFKPRDMDPTRIESIFGELRTILFLKQQGFHDILPHQASRSSTSYDFSAKFGRRQCFIEVKTSIRYAGRTFHDTVVKWARSITSDIVVKQLNIQNPNCINLFVMVINSSGAVALNNRNDYMQMLQEIDKSFPQYTNLHYAILTGRSSNGINDDCIYPEIEILV